MSINWKWFLYMQQWMILRGKFYAWRLQHFILPTVLGKIKLNDLHTIEIRAVWQAISKKWIKSCSILDGEILHDVHDHIDLLKYARQSRVLYRVLGKISLTSCFVEKQNEALNYGTLKWRKSFSYLFFNICDANIIFSSFTLFILYYWKIVSCIK